MEVHSHEYWATKGFTFDSYVDTKSYKLLIDMYHYLDITCSLNEKVYLWYTIPKISLEQLSSSSIFELIKKV